MKTKHLEHWNQNVILYYTLVEELYNAIFKKKNQGVE